MADPPNLQVTMMDIWRSPLIHYEAATNSLRLQQPRQLKKHSWRKSERHLNFLPIARPVTVSCWIDKASTVRGQNEKVTHNRSEGGQTTSNRTSDHRSTHVWIRPSRTLPGLAIKGTKHCRAPHVGHRLRDESAIMTTRLARTHHRSQTL